MPQRIRRPFTVTSVGDDQAWLKLLEGQKRGLQFVAYANSDTLKDLTEGNDYQVTLASQNSQGTRWRIKDAKPVDSLSPRQAPMADD